jgi:hypothetical protein
VQAEREDGGGLEGEDVVADVAHLDLRKRLRTVVRLQVLVVAGARLWKKTDRFCFEEIRSL